ncbi:MAG: hypothetical protein FJW35_10940, partial [Acidobacteria bacterium]|nr:hypothetical protein [Acidobacteriota bacterium]
MNALHDLLGALRSLRKHRGFTLAAVVTLGVGIGAVATAFSIVHGIYFRSLPYRSEESLVQVSEQDLKQGMRRIPVGYPDFADWRALNRVFEDMALYQELDRTLTRRGEPVQLEGAGITAGLFAVLGVQPVLGRDLRPEEDKAGAPPLVILSWGLWQRRFGGDPSLVGQSLLLNGRSHLVIGIMPPHVTFPNSAEFWLPAGPTAEGSARGARSYNVIARL